MTSRRAPRLPLGLATALTRLKRRFPLIGRMLRPVTARFKQREVTIAHGLGEGLRFNCGDANLTMALGTYEPELQELLRRHTPAGGVAYDIGANVGFVTVLLARLVGPTGRVVAFEPNPELAARVRANADLNEMHQVEVRSCAVGDAAGTLPFVLTADPLQSHLAGASALAPGEVIAVPVVRLDEVTDLPPPDLIKLDVEGAELQALRGMQQLLRARRPVVLCEVHGTGPEVRQLLVECGYPCECMETRDSGAANPLVVALPGARG